MVHSRTYFFVLNFTRLLLVYCLGLILFLLSRIYFLAEYGNASDLYNRKVEVAKAFFVGFRTDTMSLSYGLLPVFLLVVAIYLIPSAKLERYLLVVRNFVFVYTTVLLSVYLLILIADFFFFRYFKDHLNILVFALFEDDTKAVLTSMWTDYPVIKVVILLAVCLTLFVFFIRRILGYHIRPFNWSNKTSFGAVLIAFLLMFTALRNSWGMFPFRMQNTVVSDYVFINKIGIGGVYSLQNAFKEKSESRINTDLQATLQKYKFKSVQAAVETYLDKPCGDGKDPLSCLLARTPHNDSLENHKPHVIVIQMESMSNYLLDFQSKEFNVMGALQQPLSNAYVFRNFVSATPTTINSLEALIIASPETPVSQSVYHNRKLSTSVALPYLNAGYQTNFITGAELAWRNLGGYLSNLGFNTIIGNAAIKKDNEQAEDGEWGTYDEFVFDRIYRELESATEPQFIFAMTTTNHTPFDLPENYQPYPLTISPQLEKLLGTEKEIALKNFLTYQYANDCLGRFIERVQQSKLKDNTIIVAVGDHSAHQLLDVAGEQVLQELSVPLIIMVPDAYKPGYAVDITRFGSHKDVFPTVFNLSLSDAEYVKSGNNLMSSPADSSYFFGVYKYEMGLSKDGFVRAKENLYFNWTDNSYTSVTPTSKSPAVEFLRLKTRSYSASLSCYIKSELSKGQ